MRPSLGPASAIALALCALAASPIRAQSDSAAVAEPPVKFALFSAAWGENTDDGLRLVAQNLSPGAIRLDEISFIDLPVAEDETRLRVSLTLPAQRYAQTDLPLTDLLSGDECVARTMAEGWKLVEISNYTLNPSVRNLIIENTNSFRIYQCVRSARLTWFDASAQAEKQQEGWVLYHFESRGN